MSTVTTDAYTDVVELCAMLQCLGFSIKSVDTTSDTNLSQNSATRTVVINCQSSGLHVVLESGDATCSCPPSTSHQNSGFWQVSGVTGGKQLSKEYGSALLGSLPRAHRERLTKELQDMVRCIQENNESDIDKSKDRANAGNRSASMIELKTPEKRHLELKSETPTRYRSLDTLTGIQQASESLPAPGALQKQLTKDAEEASANNKIQSMCQRQSTYTLSSTSGSMRTTNKTSSPIQAPPNKNWLEALISAEKAAEDVLNKLSSVIREMTDDGKNDSMSSLALDVSKISVLKGGESSKPQFASSPNLSGMDIVKENLGSRLKRGESASTSNLASAKTMSKDGNPSRLRRISPNIFKFKRDSLGISKIEKLKSEDKKSSRLSSLIKPKTLVPARTSKSITDASLSPNLSASRKKFSHVKSTIPRPSSKKD